MRKYSALVNSFLSNGFYSTYTLLELVLNEATFRYVTLPYDVTVGGIEYSADNGIVNLDPPKMSSTVDKEAFKIELADPNFIYREYADTATSNGKIRVRIGFINTTGSAVTSTGGTSYGFGSPVLDILDTIAIYDGVIDQPKYVISQDEGVLFQLTGSAPMAALDAVNPMYTSKFMNNQRIPNGVVDTCFDKVSFGGRSQEILWGKKK
jgi:hypothetical protein